MIQEHEHGEEVYTLHKKLPMGMYVNGVKQQDYSLLESNGVAEKVFADRLNGKPYTWMGNVCTIAVDELAGTKIGGPARKEYVASGGSVAIHPLLLQVPLADVSSMLVEIHRTVWQNLVRNQESLCKYCGEKFVLDIDLNRLKLREADARKLASKDDWETLICDLPKGYKFQALQIYQGRPDQKLMEEFDGVVFNRFIFRNPTLGDAIKNERFASDSITMWRRIAHDCVLDIQAVDRTTGMVTANLPENAIRMLGMSLYDEHLLSADLTAIKEAIYKLPTMPFDYEETCPNSICRRPTPVTIEAGNFFQA